MTESLPPEDPRDALIRGQAALIAGLFAQVTGERPSDGFVHSLLERAARAVRGACLLIRALVVAARMVCTSWSPAPTC